jgi:hypothetical protein
MPNAVAGPIIICASWPAPITPTTGYSDFTEVILLAAWLATDVIQYPPLVPYGYGP